MSTMAGKTVLITGATDGLGRQVAYDLARQGARLLLHGRNPDKGEELLSALLTDSGNHELHYLNADLSSLAEIRDMALALCATETQLDVLVNNAGIGPRTPDSPRQESKDGIELFFAVNYLSGYLLTHLVLPLLTAAAPARVINVASIGQEAIDFADPQLLNDYDDARAYRQSKLAQIIFTKDLATALDGSGVTVNCLHPATLMNTKMVFDSTYFPGTMASIEDGARALEQLITAPELTSVTGAYFNGLERDDADPQANNPEARKALRLLSERLTRAYI